MDSMDRAPAGRPTDKWWLARSVLIVVICALTGLFAVLLATAAKNPQLEIHWPKDVDPVVTGVEIVMVLILAALTVWRGRWPVQLSLIASILTILLPLGGMVPTVLMFNVLISDVRRGWRVGCSAMAILAIFVSIWRDTQHRSHDTSFWRNVLAMRDGQDFPWWLVVALTALIAAVVIGIAAFVRDWRRGHQAERDAEEARGELTTQLLRQQEREEVAREVHDALGHRLSLLNLHASALEMQAKGNEPLARSARVVQENAQQSAADLRALLAVLRDPKTPELHDGLPGLADLPQLLEETRLAGTPITASFFVDDSGPLNPEFSRDCYRIVQELLTNARKHAPGEPLRIHIDVTPQHGADITAVNQLSPATPDEFTEGNGLLGIRERARRTGGDAEAAIEHNVSTGSGDTAVFRTTVHLPWPDAKAP
ncbi:signal transduction histidine kinase [Branchiibius hedensis]|uniref:histidine kinase n=1 Tax=Branchiibius hedensis TaxID=672460 RepID=A0A2Y8ZTK7_9MICO|nr:histidine kinase [Branchiibius hedensis]PWJ26920.1 signal transduction histidine kinase [Branchiibius hedensis]SSA35731.1 Signal transduction histidine kinase [Branchiibius hedensis]